MPAKPLFTGSIPVAAFQHLFPSQLTGSRRAALSLCTTLCEKPLSYIFGLPRSFGKYLLAYELRL